MNGILNVYKPSGITSYAVVARVKRLSHERRVGHAGTLDPLASGVLPVCIGQATRVIEYLMESRKTYRAEINLGVATDTGDAEGQVIERKDASGVGRDALLAVLDGFRGLIEQTPPMFSAVKHKGTPLYRLARAGITVERHSRTAQIYELELVAWDSPIAKIQVTCSRGTYIRTLAEDIGKALGCGASLRALERIRYGPFDIHDAVQLTDLENAFNMGDAAGLLRPIDVVIEHWPTLLVDAELADDVRHGRPLAADSVGSIIDLEASVGPKNRIRACTLDGCFLGVLRFNSDNQQWQPEKVFSC